MSADVVSSLGMVIALVVMVVMVRGRVARFLAIVALVIAVLHAVALLIPA